MDKPPGFLDDRSMIDSPETMSINSDIASHHMDSGLEDDDDLSITQGDASAKSKKKDGEFSLESALFSVAVKAKRFAEERRSKRKFNFPSFKGQSVDSEKERASEEGTELNSQERPFSEELGSKVDEGVLDTKVDLSNKDENKLVTKDVHVLQQEDSDNESRGDDDVVDVK